MSREGVDEAWARLTPAQALAAGKTFVVGYVSEDTTGKSLTSAEVRAYLAAGLGVLLVYEYSTTAAEQGSARGRRDATIAVRQAWALGYPPGCAIAFAIDENTAGRASVVGPYCAGFTAGVRTAGYRSMVYGGLATVQYALDHQLVDLAWQTYAWSGTPPVWDPRCVLRQYRNAVTIDGIDLDLDVALVDDYGAWTPGGPMDPNYARNAERYLWRLGTLVPDIANGELDGEAGAVHLELVDVLLELKKFLAAPPAVPVALSADDRAAIAADLKTQVADAVRTELANAAEAVVAGLTTPAVKSA